LRDGETGEQILTLVESDRHSLLTSGWNPPERFAAPGRDGNTMIYGIIIRPSDFDPAKEYPVVEYIYAGPHGFFTEKGFSTFELYREWADLGFVFVVLDGMGTNWRSKAFHNVCYKNLHDAGFPDRIAWIQAAAKARPWMDLSRVGIWGTSAGGQNAGAALLFHGDFYKVAAADTGCHDNRLDKLWWNELWMGWPVDEAYKASSNVTNAAKLQGKLLLVGGGMDDNVDPSSTLQFANALNKAGKDFAFLFIPDGEHACGHTALGQKKMRQFFRRHLLEN
jgi:dipeptidyl aminopeptidase/acylaminoacyl peptidase